MAKCREFKALQKIASVQASIRNHLGQNRILCRRDTFKQTRSAALAEWRQQLAA